MSTNHTQNYSLCQWQPDDKVLRTDFNEDNAKIDAAIKAVDRRADSLQSALGSKTDKAALDSLKATVSQQGTVLDGKGNCQLAVTTYTGSGKFGKDNPNRLTFSKKPMVIFVCSAYDVMTLLQGMNVSWADKNTNDGATVRVTWSGNSVSWYASTHYDQLSTENDTFRVIALLQAD